MRIKGGADSGRGLVALGATLAALWATTAGAVNINFVSGSAGNDCGDAGAVQALGGADRQHGEGRADAVVDHRPVRPVQAVARRRNADVDVYMVDVIWAPQLADQFLDLSEAAADVIPDHFPSIIESQTVDGKLVAMPFFTDAPALYYRKDLLDKYGAKAPTTWTS